MKVGYFIAEFPGQTHIFFWRERRALSDLGIDTRLISTRLPKKQLMSHDWAAEAIAQTAYLWPFTLSDFFASTWNVFTAGPIGWFRCLRAIVQSEGMTFKKRLLLFAMVLMAGKLRRIARRSGWSHVHVHFIADAAHIAMFAHLLGGITYSLSLHAPLAEYGPNQRLKWKWATFGTVITRRLMSALKEELPDVVPARLALAPMGVEVDQFKRPSPYQPWRGQGDAVLFSCGRLSPSKGHEFLIEAVRLLVDRGLNVKLTIAGEDKLGGQGYRQVLQRIAGEQGISDKVHFLGAVSEPVIFAELCRAHVFVLASLAEALGVAYMEAMATSTPTVGTNAGGVPELIDDRVDGRLVPPQDALALADAIEQILRDPELAMKLSEAGRKKVVERFSSRNSAETLASCLRETLSDRLKSPTTETTIA